MEREESEVETNYAREFFLRGVDTLTKAYQQNQDNPVQMSMIGDAYISGSVEELPPEETKEIIKPLNQIKEAYAEESLKNYNAKQTAVARQSNEVSLRQAYDSAVQSSERQEPLSVQNLKNSAFIAIARDNAAKGIISEKFANDQIEELGAASIVNNLSAAMLDPTVSEKHKLQFLYKYVIGKTGDQSVDTLMDPDKRLQTVMQVLNGTRQVKAYEEEIKKKQQEETENAFEKKLLALKKEIILGKEDGIKLSPEEILVKQNELYQLADPKDYDKIANITKDITPSSTSGIVRKYIQDLKNSGEWNEEKLNELIDKNALSAADIESEAKELSDIYHQNLKLADPILSEARAALKYTEANPTEYFAFMARFGAEISDTPLTRAQVMAKGRQALKDTLALGNVAPLVSKAAKDYFAERNGISYKDAMQIHGQIMNDVSTQLRKQNKTATFEDVKAPLRRKLKQFMEEKKQQGLQVDVFDADGKKIPEETVLDMQVAEIKRETERVEIYGKR